MMLFNNNNCIYLYIYEIIIIIMKQQYIKDFLDERPTKMS